MSVLPRPEAEPLETAGVEAWAAQFRRLLLDLVGHVTRGILRHPDPAWRRAQLRAVRDDVDIALTAAEQGDA